MRDGGPRPLADVVRYASTKELEDLVRDLADWVDVHNDANDSPELEALLARARRATGDRR